MRSILSYNLTLSNVDLAIALLAPSDASLSYFNSRCVLAETLWQRVTPKICQFESTYIIRFY